MSDINLTPEELEAMLDRAARRGAREALRSLGLHDEDAHKDIVEMRTLLESFRDTKKSIWTAAVKLITVALLSFIAASVWMQVGNK
jgi:2-iminoacetate synthase ThiH